MNVRWRVVGVAVLVVLAGCGALSPGDGTPTESDGERPGETTPETGFEGGLSDGQPVDAFALAETHRDALTTRSFTVTARTTVQYANGTAALWLSVRTLVDPDAGAVYSQQTAGGSEPFQFGVPSPGDVAVWLTGDANLRRYTLANGTTRVREGIGRNVPPFEQATRWEELAALLSDGDARFLTGDSDTAVATGGDTAMTYGEPEDLTVTVGLSEGAHVQRYTVAYETTRDGRPLQVTRTVRFTNVGETAVERPDWVSNARNDTD